MRLVQLLLFLPQEVDDKLLVFLDKVVGQPLFLKIGTKMLPPKRIKSVEERKLGWPDAIDASRGVDNMVLDGVRGHSWRLRRGRGRVVGMRGMAVTKKTPQDAVLVSRLGTSSEGCRLGRSARILLALVHLLLELLGLLFVDEA